MGPEACSAADRPGQSGADSSAANDAEAVCRPAPVSCPPSAGAATGTGHTHPSTFPYPVPAPATDSPATRGTPAKRETDEQVTGESHELDVDAALSLLGQQFAEVVSVLLPRLHNALVGTYAPDERDLGTLVDLRTLLLRTSHEIAARTGTSQTTSLPDLQQTWTAHQSQQNSRGALQGLATCSGPEAISASLEWVRSTASRLAVGWEPQDAALAAGLLSLAELAVRGQADDADDDDLIAQSLQLKDRLPAEAGKAVSAGRTPPHPARRLRPSTGGVCDISRNSHGSL